MGIPELLVHISAPATVQDDKRYRAIAQSVLNFEPACVLKIGSNGDIDIVETSSRAECVFPFVGPHVDDSVLGDNPRGDTQMEMDCQRSGRIPGIDSRSLPRRAEESQESFFEARSQLVWESSGRTPSNLYKDFLSGELSGGTDQDKPRPKTAPATSGSYVQVPASSCRKRARSLSSSFHSFTSVVPDSQPTPVPVLDATFSLPKSGPPATGDHRHRLEAPSACLNEGGQSYIAKKRCLPHMRTLHAAELEATVDQNESADEDAICHLLSQSSIETISSTNDLNTKHTGTSPSSTVSPSPPVNPTFYRNETRGSPPAGSGSLNRVSIDLQAPKVTATGVPTRVSPAPLTGLDGQSKDRTFRPHSSRLRRRPAPDYIISNTPSDVCSPLPPTGLKHFRSHISVTLQTIAQRLSLGHRFRPEYVRRDIMVLERGYWLLIVDLASDQEVSRTRTAPCYLGPRGAGDSIGPMWPVSEYCVYPPPLWTRGEFGTFWRHLTTFITEGKAGWGVRAFKEEDGGPLAPPLQSSRTRLRVKIYTWGEIIGHMWLAMWVLSDKLTSLARMEWIAGDETTVVQMTGDRHRQGTLAPWRHLGPQGERGAWGVGINRG